MVSDFSVKALIADWEKDLLGPNPFVVLGEFGDSMTLRFDPQVLMECESNQLRVVGQLSYGSTELKASDNTICFSVDQDVDPQGAYEIEVLTVVTDMPGIDVASFSPSMICQGGGFNGSAGHVLLKYPSGGRLLASAGHWMDLSKLSVTPEKFYQVASLTYGPGYTNNLLTQYRDYETQEEREAFLTKRAAKMIQQSAPCVCKPVVNDMVADVKRDHKQLMLWAISCWKLPLLHHVFATWFGNFASEAFDLRPDSCCPHR